MCTLGNQKTVHRQHLRCSVPILSLNHLCISRRFSKKICRADIYAQPKRALVLRHNLLGRLCPLIISRKKPSRRVDAESNLESLKIFPKEHRLTFPLDPIRWMELGFFPSTLSLTVPWSRATYDSNRFLGYGFLSWNGISICCINVPNNIDLNLDSLFDENFPCLLLINA